MSSRNRAILAALAMLLLSGVLYAALAQDSAQLDAAAERVALVPTTVGDWRGTDQETEREAFEQAGAKGYWMREYVNSRSKETVLVILMCGRTGKMSVHTPEVCYRGAGFEMRDQPASCSIRGADAELGSFWTAQFTKKGDRPANLRLYWAWNAQGQWDASPAPRWQFRGSPFLYKLYVSHDMGRQQSVAPGADVTAQFMREFLPVVETTLFR
jgi:Protein of unknown function (DUF3485)